MKKLTGQFKHQAGQLTVDFLFSLVLIFSVTALLGALTTALTLTEIVQYVSFAGSRAHFAADMTDVDQQNVGKAKMNALIKSLPFLATAQRGGWIVLPPQSRDVGDFTGYREKINAPPDRNQFVGAQIQFVLPMLNIQLPFLGDAIQPPSGGAFKATVSSFLLREPSFAECQRFMASSFEYLLNGNYSGPNLSSSRFFPITDNGC